MSSLPAILLFLALVSVSEPAVADFGISLDEIVQSAEKLPPAAASGFESWHAGANRRRFNDHNPGVGLRGPGGWVLGGYYNSVRRHSVYGGREFQWRLAGDDAAHVNFGLVVGGVSGYSGGIRIGGGKHGIHPAFLPELVLASSFGEVVLAYVPRFSKVPQTLALQLRVYWP